MKAAIVEAFKARKTILIATESGAEGINLQFCSVVINFDLPWNPQRIEQRIGRCHRFGQKIDVTVVNFLNLKNRAEARVHELLNSKFNLFQGVFGASDQVLGAIGDGIDFEARVLEIVQKCRTADEVDAAFDKLQAELEETIRADMQAARQTVIDNLDTAVVKKLKDRDGEIRHVLDTYEQSLLTLVRAELPAARFHEDELRRFDYDGKTWTTEWPKAEEAGWQFLRIADGTLALDLVTAAKERRLPPAALRFHYVPGQHGVFGDVAQLVGAKGALSAAKVSFQVADKIMERLVLAAITSDGRTVEPATLERLFLVPAAMEDVETGAGVSVDAALLARLDAVLQEVQQQASEWFDETSQKLNRYASDMEKGLDKEIADLEERVRELREQSRNPSLSLDEKLKFQREASKLDKQKDTLVAERFARKRKIQDDVDDMLDKVAESLRLKPQVEPLFTISWELTR
jgi:hypothetical protein